MNLSPTIVAEIEARTDDFRLWLTREASKGKIGTRDLQLSIGHSGRMQLKFRPPWRNVSAELLDGDDTPGT